MRTELTYTCSVISWIECVSCSTVAGASRGGGVTRMVTGQHRTKRVTWKLVSKRIVVLLALYQRVYIYITQLSSLF